jgi:hypothetical protein
MRIPTEGTEVTVRLEYVISASKIINDEYDETEYTLKVILRDVGPLSVEFENEKDLEYYFDEIDGYINARDSSIS